METKIIKQEPTEKNTFSLDQKEMAQAGLCFGHKTSKINPKMKPYIKEIRNLVHIIDLEMTAERLEEALKYIKELISKKGTIMLVGTKIQVKKLIEDTAEECNLPYVIQRWVGGTFTNFDIIKKRVNRFKDLEENKKKGEFDKYTKKERSKIDKELSNLKAKFGGLRDLKELPNAVFVCDIKSDELAVKEARNKGIKIIAIADTNVNPDLVDYPIPANDDAISSVKYILEKVKEVILKENGKHQSD